MNISDIILRAIRISVFIILVSSVGQQNISPFTQELLADKYIHNYEFNNYEGKSDVVKETPPTDWIQYPGFMLNNYSVNKDAIKTISIDDCPKYKKYTRTIITSSTQGQLSDTGWQEVSTFSTCEDQDTGEQSPDCTTENLPGESMGLGDETISTCNFTRIDCIEKCECEADPITTTISIAFPSVGFLTDKIETVAETAPMISEMSLSVGASFSVEEGEECCEEDNKKPPVGYKKYSGTVNASLSVSLNVPGWDWRLNSQWQGLYRVRAQISLGPQITLGPSASATASGKAYDGDKCKSCITASVEGSIDVEISFGGTISCEVWAFEGGWFEISGSFELHAELAVGTSIGASGQTELPPCPIDLSGSISYGSLTGTATAGVEVWGTGISFSKSVTILNGVTSSF